MREIKLSRGKVALVDDWNYNWLSKWRWYAHKNTYGGYSAASNIKLSNGKRHTILMHRLILNLKFGDGKQCDHKNKNTLDNCEHNLRASTPTQNQHNRKLQKGTSKYKGVRKARHKWRAGIKINGKNKHLGVFVNERVAALIYDLNARKYFGQFACTNF